jgi:hypothetical protein
MLTFVVHLALEFLRTGTDHEGICKFLADLMYELRGNKTPLMLLSNILCNVIIVSTLPHKTAIPLSFVETFYKCVEARVRDHHGNGSPSDYYKAKPQR